MEKELVCINCPMGCRVSATVEGTNIVRVSGNGCKRGEIYARSELTRPVRMVTALSRVEGSDFPLPVKTDRPIDKELIFSALEALRAAAAPKNTAAGDVVLKNICGTDASFVATADAR